MFPLIAVDEILKKAQWNRLKQNSKGSKIILIKRDDCHLIILLIMTEKLIKGC